MVHLFVFVYLRAFMFGCFSGRWFSVCCCLFVSPFDFACLFAFSCLFVFVRCFVRLLRVYVCLFVFVCFVLISCVCFGFFGSFVTCCRLLTSLFGRCSLSFVFYQCAVNRL